jgi:hypothetical protein
MSEYTKIVQCFLPNLVAGEYIIDVTQEIKHDGATKGAAHKQMKVGVDAARFTLGSDDVYSVYPPANTTGNYKYHLPHIVFNRRTLPWERTIDGNNPDSENPIPWMALLLVDEEDMKTIRIEQTDLKEILNSNQTDGISRPQIYANKKEGDKTLALMPWESTEQKCLTIDLTTEQFQKYLPATKDLTYLAHSKIVTIDHKDSNGIGDVAGNTGYFSVLMGNRIVREKQNYTAVVVSLEGHQAYLSQKTGLQAKVRMVVLASWSFNNFGETTFGTLLSEVKVQSMMLHPMLTSGHVLEKYTKNGYVPMRHQMRNGAKNISWYRGPFIPNESDTFSDIDIENEYIKFSSSDSALYYDQDTGFLDVSIASAWELGKIMALNNQEFTKAMVTWHNDPVNDDAKTDVKPVKKSDLVKWLGGKSPEMPEKNDSSEQYRHFPDEVKSYLKALAKLEGLPLSYLIPDQKCINNDKNTPDSLTVFYLNSKWIWALLDGAVGLSRVGLTDTSTQTKDIIKEVYGLGPITGFLFHSPIVSGWRGIEIKAYEKKDEKDKLLDNGKKIRFERITPDIFLGIFQGKISKIEVIQPYEGLHFGVGEKDGDSQVIEKAIKNVDGKIDSHNKLEINASLLNKDSHVLAVSELSAKLYEKAPTEKFTSAEYAYQMIDSPIKATFDINYNQ